MLAIEGRDETKCGRSVHQPGAAIKQTIERANTARNIYNGAGACTRVLSDKPRLKAFCRVAFSVRFKFRAIFAARVLLPASFFNVRIS
jgi:hypothetical protein